MALSDADLVRRLADGDEWAKEALYRKHVKAVYRTALRLLAHRADAEDVVQDAFLTMYSEIEHLREPASIASWLLRITVRQAHRRFRRRRLLRVLGFERTAPEVTLENAACEGTSPETREALALLERELQRLPIHQRSAWVLRCVEGYSLEEVAAACDCSLATVKRWIAAANAMILVRIELEVTDET